MNNKPLTQKDINRFEELKTLKAWCPEFFELRERIAEAAQKQRNHEDILGIGDRQI